MIFELRTYLLRAGALDEYVRAVAEHGRPTRGDLYGKLEGHWSSTSDGSLRLFTLWSYESAAERERLRAALASNKAWTEGFLPRIGDLVMAERNTLLAPISPLRAPDTTPNVYELRTVSVCGPKTRAFREALAQMLPIAARYARLVGVFSTEVGDLGNVLSLWAHESRERFAAAGSALSADLAWIQQQERTASWIEGTGVDVLEPTPISPLP